MIPRVLQPDTLAYEDAEEKSPNTSQCPNCQGTNIVYKVEDSIDVGVGYGIPCEESYTCADCGTQIE